MGCGDGTCRKEKPLKGPNIRGRYARDLRGDKDVLYEFTNESDYSNIGSDVWQGTLREDNSHVRLRNKFRDMSDLPSTSS